MQAKRVTLTMPQNSEKLPFIGSFPLLRAMMEKNNYDGLPGECLVDEHGDVLAIGVVDPDGYPLYAKLCVFEVREDVRRKHLGKRLLVDIVNKYDEVKLVAMRQAYEFYRNCGFVFCEGEPDPRVNVAYMYSII